MKLVMGVTRILLIGLLLLGAVACGSGGNDHHPPEDNGSSNWDKMKWDQDNWA